MTTSYRVLGSVLRAILDGNVDRQAVARARAVVSVKILRHRESALGAFGVILEGEQGAVRDLAGLALARVEGGLQEFLGLPAHDEITVVAGASGVAIGKEELALVTSKVVGSPDGLEEQEWVVDIVSLGAVTFLDKVGVCNVGPVVVRVEFARLATAWESQFDTDSVSAMSIQVLLSRHLVPVERRFGVLVVVQAVETECPLRQEELVGRITWPLAKGRIREGASEVTEHVVAGNHLEALGERLDVLEVVKVVPEKG